MHGVSEKCRSTPTTDDTNAKLNESVRTEWIVTNPRGANVENVGSFFNIVSVVLSQRDGCWFINVIHKSRYRVETRIVAGIGSQKIFRAKGRGFWPFFDKGNGFNRKGVRTRVPSELLSKQNTECRMRE
jgi:hypothetical protein